MAWQRKIPFGYQVQNGRINCHPEEAELVRAMIAFLESTNFEDALRTAVSLGGDSDTLAAITGSIAEAFYGVPEELRQECCQRLTPELAEILREWESALYNEKVCGII